MHAPQTPVQRLAKLGRSRSLLARSGWDFGELNQHLILHMSDFERAKLEVAGVSEIPSPDSIKDALQLILGRAAEGVAPDPDLIHSLHSKLDPENGPSYRSGAARALCPNHQPLPASLVERSLERFCQWVSSPGFGELHAVEQMTLCQLRLIEISPFPRHSAVTASGFGVFFPLKAGFLLPRFLAQDAGRFWESLSQALTFSTSPLVDFNLAACQAAYDELERIPLS